MRQIPGFSRRQAKRYESTWVDALEAVGRREDTGLPPLHIPNDGPPQARLWAARDPVSGCAFLSDPGSTLCLSDRTADTRDRAGCPREG